MKNEKEPIEKMIQGRVIPAGTEQETGLTRWHVSDPLGGQRKQSKKRRRKLPPAL